MQFLISSLVLSALGQAGCDNEADPGPHGYQYIASQFEYLSEVVEKRLSMDGSLGEFRFSIRFQSKQNGKDYAVTLNPSYEPEPGKADVILMEMTLNNSNQVWMIENGLVKSTKGEFYLGQLASGNLAGFSAADFVVAKPRHLLWHFDGNCLTSLNDGALVAYEKDDFSSFLGQTIKSISPSYAVVNSTIERVNEPPAQPRPDFRSYIKAVSLQNQVVTQESRFSQSMENKVYYYDELQVSTWIKSSDEFNCETGIITEADMSFGLRMEKLGYHAPMAYPMSSEEYFRYGHAFNTSFGRSSTFDEYDTCYYNVDYSRLEEDNFQKVVPKGQGWLTPSGGAFVERAPTREYKDGYGRTMVEESWEYFVDYGDFLLFGLKFK